MKIRINLINIFVIITSIISSVMTVLFMDNITKGYKLILIFPILFLIIYSILFGNIDVKECKTPIVIYGVLAIQWIRYVVMPVFIAMAGERPGVTYLYQSEESLNTANIIMIIDLLASSIFMWILSNKRKNKEKEQEEKRFVGNKLFYLGFIFLAILVYLFIGRNSNMINFIMIKVNGSHRAGDIVGTNIVIGRQIVLIAIMLAFLWIGTECAKKYKETEHNIYLYSSLIIASFNVAIIVGERRTTQVYAAFCSIIILFRLYPEKKKKILLVVGGVAVSIIALMSIYKFFAAFQYNSYFEAIKKSNFNIGEWSKILQIYFGGPQILAEVIEFDNIYNLPIQNCIYDFLRSTVPISFFVKNGGNVTSEIFNMFIYGGRQSTGYLISTAGYGYMYLGVLFSWVFTVLNIGIAYFAEVMMKEGKSYEMMYVWGYVLIRILFSFMTNTPNIINGATLIICTAGIVFKLGEILNRGSYDVEEDIVFGEC